MEIVIIQSDPVVFDGTTSTANCGSIDQYRWQIDDVTVSWSSVYSHTFNLASGESERVFKVQLRVRNTAGKYGYKTIYVTVTRNNKSLYYLTDHLGSVRVTVNEQGDPVGWDDYYPFGLAEPVPKTFGMPGRTQNTSNPNDDVKFTGYELEQQGDLGIYHAGARMYDPVVGRFMQRDPFYGLYPGTSAYVYALNNPLIFIDPDGKRVVFRSREEAEYLVSDLNSIFNRVFGFENAFSVVQETRTEEVDGEKVEVDIFRIVGNEDFDWNTNEHTQALQEVLAVDHDIYGSLSGDGELLTGHRGGRVLSESAFELSYLLPLDGEQGTVGFASNPPNHSLGGVALHEMLYHLHPQGVLDDQRSVTFRGGGVSVTARGPNIMRARFQLRRGSVHGPGNRARRIPYNGNN